MVGPVIRSSGGSRKEVTKVGHHRGASKGGAAGRFERYKTVAEGALAFAFTPRTALPSSTIPQRPLVLSHTQLNIHYQTCSYSYNGSNRRAKMGKPKKSRLASS